MNIQYLQFGTALMILIRSDAMIPELFTLVDKTSTFIRFYIVKKILSYDF